MDGKRFAECIGALYQRWEVEKTLAVGCDGIVIVASHREDDEEREPLSRIFAQAAGMGQLRQSEWLMAFTEGCIFVLANSDKAKNAIKGMVGQLPSHGFARRVEVLTRDKADKNKTNFAQLVTALKASKAGRKVGSLVRERSSGNFARAWEEALGQDLDVVDISDDIWEAVNAQKNMSKATMVSDKMSDAGDTDTGSFSGKKRKAPETSKPSRLQDNLMRALECSVCINIMVAPVYQCQAGHSICKYCVEKVTKCPMCRCDMSSSHRIRNLALEQMAEGMDGFSCMHAAQGCKHVVSYAQLEEHQKSCGFGPVSCPWAWYRRTGPRPCGWQGPASALIDHLHTKHGERSSKLNMEPGSASQSDGWSHRVLIQSPHQSYTANFEAVLDVKKPNEKVFFRMDHRGKEQMSFTCVRYMGVSSSVGAATNDWFCELTAGRYSKQDPSKQCCRRAMWSGRVHPIGHTPRELRDAGEGLFLQASQVRLLAEREKGGEGGDGTTGSVLIHLRFFRDKDSSGKLGLPPMQEKELADSGETGSDSDDEDDDVEDEDEDEEPQGGSSSQQANNPMPYQLLHISGLL